MMLATLFAQLVSPEIVPIILGIVRYLYFAFCPDPYSPDNLRHFGDVLAMRHFAGEFWRNPASPGMADWWAIAIDNLLDLFDPEQLIRGDH